MAIDGGKDSLSMVVSAGNELVKVPNLEKQKIWRNWNILGARNSGANSVRDMLRCQEGRDARLEGVER